MIATVASRNTNDFGKFIKKEPGSTSLYYLYPKFYSRFIANGGVVTKNTTIQDIKNYLVIHTNPLHDVDTTFTTTSVRAPRRGGDGPGGRGGDGPGERDHYELQRPPFRLLKKQHRNFANNPAHPRHLPYESVTNSDHTFVRAVGGQRQRDLPAATQRLNESMRVGTSATGIYYYTCANGSIPSHPQSAGLFAHGLGLLNLDPRNPENNGVHQDPELQARLSINAANDTVYQATCASDITRGTCFVAIFYF